MSGSRDAAARCADERSFNLTVVVDGPADSDAESQPSPIKSRQPAVSRIAILRAIIVCSEGKGQKTHARIIPRSCGAERQLWRWISIAPNALLRFAVQPLIEDHEVDRVD